MKKVPVQYMMDPRIQSLNRPQIKMSEVAQDNNDDWTTWDCCNNDQLSSIFLIVGYALLILKLWRVQILHPFKILTVFLHELGHATAVWLTCGKVTGMEVHPNEGGVTKYVGGLALIVIPAGYLGSAVWGSALVVASANTLASEIAAGVLIFFLFVFLFFAENGYLRVLNLGFIVLLGGTLACQMLNWTNGVNVLEYLTLFIGTMSCLFSIYDIYDDLISRRVNESDASKFAEMTKTSSRCWGIIWGVMALCTLIGAVYFHILLLSDENEPRVDKMEDLSTRTTIIVVCAATVVVLGLGHTLFTKKVMI